ncbi:MAG: cysteine desulfurase family protein [Chitinophagales bacterium]
MKVYLDSAATSQLDPLVLDEMLPFFTEVHGNPSSTHGFGRTAKAGIEKSRKTIASAINASSLEIVFTSCGTESNNMAIKCAVQHYDVKHIITSPIEHKCVFNTCQELAAMNIGVQLHYVDVKSCGGIEMDSLAQLLEKCNGEKVLVSLMHANNEIGTLLDIKAVGEICDKYGALFHSDTVQTVGHYKINVKDLNVHFLSGSAHKFHGPKGVGFLYMRSDTKVCPLIHGGGQERTHRSGTENVAGIVGMAKALQLSEDNMEAYKDHILDLRSYMMSELHANFDDIKFNGNVENGLYTVLNVSFSDKFKSDMLLFNLDMAGIAVSGGSACSSGANMGSHVMQGIGHDSKRRAVRFSFSHFNTKEEIDYTIAELKKIAAREMASIN